MSRSFCPRLSEARHLLPLVRSHIIAAASRYPLSTGLALDLLPIVEDGLFGYELLPDRNTHTYVSIGCNAHGEPMLRKTLYGVGAPNALQLVAVNGHILSRSERAARYSTHQRDSYFPDWPAAAESAWAQLLFLFPERPRQLVAVREHVHRCLDEALSIAHSHLAQWNPFIQFYGLPNEAQQGFALKGVHGEHGELIFQRPDIWMLRWKAPPQAVYESWSVLLPDLDAVHDTAHLNRASQIDLRLGLRAPGIPRDAQALRRHRHGAIINYYVAPPTMEQDPLTIEVPREFHRRMAAIIEAVQTGIWQRGVHDLLGYATDYAFGDKRGLQTLVLKSKYRSAYVRLQWETIMADTDADRKRVEEVIKNAINELS